LRLKSVFLICRRLAETLVFYRDVLGLESLSAHRLQLADEVELHLHSPLSEDEQEQFGLSNPSEGPRPGVVLSLRVEQLLPYLDRLQPEQVRSGPLRAPWGDRLLIVEDPEGNLVELAAPPER
jgi:catechol 2,3-dioxygenase-like lactoylglutathione lyase family enzyme